MSHLRTKTIATLLPAALFIVAITATMAVLSAETALLRATTTLLTYKSEQIREFALNQWQILEDLQLSDDVLYRQSAVTAIQSYAASTVRGETETVFALDPAGRVELSTRMIEIPLELRRNLIAEAQPTGGGWREFSVDDRAYVGQSFLVPPLEWTVFVVAARSEFFSEITTLVRTMAMIGAAVAVASVVGAVGFSAALSKPVETITAALLEIRRSGDANRQVRVDRDDELGVMAREFNTTHAALHSALAAERHAVEAAQHRENESLHLLALATEYKDFETGRHLLRVGEMARLLAELYGCRQSLIDTLVRAAPLHDVGKICIPDAILLKPGALTHEEFAVIQTHTTIGHAILREAESRFLKAGAEIALTHHERWDGRGYPSGLREEEIPLMGRIVAVVDVLDALTSERPYKEAWTPDAAFAEIARNAGAHFDPELAGLMLKHRGVFEDILRRHADPDPV